jgi:hypothetical protein
MISVITCIGNENKYEKFLLPSLHRTTELLWHNNLDSLELITVKGSDYKNISEAYNFGSSKASHPIKVFIHDDIDMLEPNWVFKILKGFSENTNCGLLGLVGSKKVNHYDNWWENSKEIYGDQIIREIDPCNIRGKLIPKKGVYDLEVIDGCFMATNRDFKFDEKLQSDGFLSAYEHDYCMQFKSSNLDIGLINHLTWHACKVQGKIRDKIIFEDYRKKWNIFK